MNKNTGLLLAITLIITGAIMIFFGLERPVNIVTADGVETIQTRAWNVDRILQDAGYTLGEYDQVTPAAGSRIGWNEGIWIRLASTVRIIDLSRGLDITIPSVDRLPANILQAAGVSIFPGDEILLNGKNLDPEQPLPEQDATVLQIRPAFRLQVAEDQIQYTGYSAAPTLGQALWRITPPLSTEDTVSELLHASPRFLETVELKRAMPVSIKVDGQKVDALTSLDTVGQALNQAGISLQGMDYAVPSEDSLLPAKGQVEVVRVHEEIILEQTTIPYTSETIMDPETPLDQRRIIESGQYGLKISRERILFENGEETLRTKDAEWVAAEPQSELVGIGTQVVLGTVDSPQGSKEYWRSLSAYATSYSPCRLGTGECSYTTAAGLELKKGVVAVKCSLFSSLRGQQVYIPGYGLAVIGDCGGGYGGSFWVDLGFTDENYESWHETVTVYFLTPVPATILYELQ